MSGKMVVCVLCAVLFSSVLGIGAEDEWNEKKTQHFIVYYKNIPEDFVETVLNASEDYYDQITDNLGFSRHKGWSFNNRARIYIYDDQQDYIESAHQSNWSAGAAYYNSRMIKTYPSAAGFFDSLLPHELGHIIFHEFIGVHVSIPRWFDEGVAMYQERARRWGANQKVKKAMEDGTFIPLQDLGKVRLARDSSKEKVELFYAESASAVYFLIHEYGEFRFLNFCRKLQGGNKFNHALELIYPRFKTLDRMNKAWVSYLERQ